MLNSISLYFVQDKCYFFPSTETSQVAEKQWIKIKMESNDWEHRNSVICFKPIHVNRKNIEHIFCIIFHKKRDRLASWKCFFLHFRSGILMNSHVLLNVIPTICRQAISAWGRIWDIPHNILHLNLTYFKIYHHFSGNFRKRLLRRHFTNK